MKCPFCEQEGKKSKVTIGPGGSTLMGYSVFYDEDGQFHNHDPNTHSVQYACSNGHRFVDKEIRGCPSCNYGRKHEIVRLP